jgi:glutaminyl-peptide cyclotransferase
MGVGRIFTETAKPLGRAAATAVLAMGLHPVPAAAQAPVCTYQVVNTFPHDDQAFTQGLLYSNGELFESTGLREESTLRRVELTTGQVLQIRHLGDIYFGEGLALWQDRLLQLTWQEETGFIWDAQTLAPEGSFSYTGEGWGLTHDTRVLIMSDGTSALRHFDPDTYAEIGSVLVTDNGFPIDDLNELEWIRGEVFANWYQTDRIARIDPDTGEVIAWIDLTGLLDPVPSGAGVLNGIAWDDAGERLFVTGKKWPSLFEIELVNCPELRLFGDGFESGATIRWSVVSP